ncbi:MAG: YbaY family lipoprotein [Betaproteobacteria bacterium]
MVGSLGRAGCAVLAMVWCALAIGAEPVGVVTGTAVPRAYRDLPAGAVFEATLVDVSLADAPAEVLARQRIDGVQGFPIRFSLAFDPARIDDGMSIAVQARITAAGQLLFINDAAHLVLTRGRPAQVQVLLRPVGPAAPR